MKKGDGKFTSYFNLPLAPVLYPTEEEFLDAWSYLREVSSKIAEYGICVIQPPKTWDKNSFFKYVDLSTYSFKTKKQNVHQLFNYRHKSAPEKKEKVGEHLGYVPGRTFTMQKFEEYANKFEQRWFDGDKASNLEKEKEYWKIIDDADNYVQVQYGSDLDSSVHGSGFPLNPNSSLKSHQERGEEFQKKCKKMKLSKPSDYMTNSAWNMNNLAEKTFLHHIDEQIGGITCPMLYVGMLFTSFCWHTEDNYLYSINYNHHGKDKIWYGVPSSFAEKFEETLKKYVPDLFNTHPNLLYLLITQISPEFLRKAGVTVHTACQTQGQFVITAPRSYHAGFNAGFNCAESVNFALEDWLPFCRQACTDYRFLRRSSFSYEEFVIKASKSPDNYNVAQMLRTELKDIMKLEQERQKQVYYSGIIQLIEDKEFPYLSCNVCGYDCYISGVYCCNHRTVCCLLHASDLCNCAANMKRILIRIPLKELKDTFDSLQEYIQNNTEERVRKSNKIPLLLKDKNKMDVI